MFKFLCLSSNWLQRYGDVLYIYIKLLLQYAVLALLIVKGEKTLYCPSLCLAACHCRFLRRTQPQSRIMGFGCGIKVELVITTCTRNTVTLLWMVLLSKCTLRWLPVIGLGLLASKLSRLQPSQLSFARGRAQNNSTTPRSSSPWPSGRSGHQPGSSRPPTRHQGPTCLCKSGVIICRMSYKGRI